MAEQLFLIGNSNQFESRRGRGDLPLELGRFLYTMPWPVDPKSLNLHIACYFDDKENYAYPTDDVDLHGGVDFQVAEKTEILAPEDARVLYHYSDPRGISDVYLLGEYSNVFYGLSHLDPKSLPKKIKNQNDFDLRGDIKVKQGEVVARVGQWPFTLERKTIVLSDVEALYGRTYNHLHFETWYFPDLSKLEALGVEIPLFKRRVFSPGVLNADKSHIPFNPLLLLQGLPQI